MNPDENNTNQEGPVPPVVPDTPVTPDTPVVPDTPVTPATPETPPTPPEAPNLDQVAADLANVAPADVAPDTTPAETPIASAASETTPETTPEITPEATPTSPVAPVTPDATVVPEAPIAPEPVAPETLPSPETPVDTPSDMPATPLAMSEPVAPEVSPAIPQTPPEAPTPEAPAAPQEDSYSTASANFVDDAQNPEGQPAETTSTENEEPLVPAEPVPGSIGSALAYSDTAPNHAVPVGKTSKFKLSFGKKSAITPAEPSAVGIEGAKPGRKPLTKENLKLLIAIIGGVTLVAVVAVVIFFILNSGSKTSTITPAENDDTPTNTVSSLTCTLSGDTSVFDSYGAVASGNSQIIAMYSNDILSSFGSTLKLTFSNEEAAKNAQLVERESYSSMIKSAGLTDDPFTSSYDTSGNTMTVTHQAEGDDIDSQSAKVLGFYVVKGEPVTDIDTLLDMYEADGYTCVEK